MGFKQYFQIKRYLVQTNPSFYMVNTSPTQCKEEHK